MKSDRTTLARLGRPGAGHADADPRFTRAGPPWLRHDRCDVHVAHLVTAAPRLSIPRVEAIETLSITFMVDNNSPQWPPPQ